MTQQFHYVGYIRSTALVKTLGMFAPEDLRAVTAWRSINRENLESDSYRDWVFRKQLVTEYFQVDWDAKKHGGVFPSDKLRSMVSKYALGDMVTQEVSLRFKSPRIGILLNGELKLRGRDGVFTEDSQYFMTLRSCSDKDVKKLPYVRELNKMEMEVYKSKVGTLDIVDWWTERKENYGEKESLSAHEDTRYIRLLLQVLDWEGWPGAKRIVDGVTLKPVAIRQYTMTSGKNWQLSGNMEVD